jgi:hypothetical protein
MADKPLRYYWRIYKIGQLPDHEKHGTWPHAWQTKNLKTAAKNILRMARCYCCEVGEWPRKITAVELFERGWRFSFGSSHYYGYAWEKPIK